MVYFASNDSENSLITYLTTSEQMDAFLQKGFNIYKEENEITTLIATPERGYLVSKPILPEVYTIKI